MRLALWMNLTVKYSEGIWSAGMEANEGRKGKGKGSDAEGAKGAEFRKVGRGVVGLGCGG